MPIWLTPNILKYAGIALAVVSVFGLGYYKGHSTEAQKFEAYRVEVSAAATAQEAKVSIVTQQQEMITKGATDVYKAKLSAVDSYYRGLRQSTSGGTLPVIPNGPTRADGSTDYAVLTSQCAETTQQLISLQSWIGDQQNAFKEISK